MNRFLRLTALLFAVLLMAGCSMPMAGLKQPYYNQPAEQTVISDEVSQEFIDAVNDLALELMTSDVIAKASNPPLIVIRPMETAGEVSFNTNKYMESERSILMNKAGNKVRFIDKETTEEANYYLYSVISVESNPSSGGGGRIRQRGMDSIQQSALSGNKLYQMAERPAESGTEDTSVKSYKITMNLIDPHTNTSVWKNESGFRPKEIAPNGGGGGKKKRGK